MVEVVEKIPGHWYIDQRNGTGWKWDPQDETDPYPWINAFRLRASEAGGPQSVYDLTATIEPCDRVLKRVFPRRWSLTDDALLAILRRVEEGESAAVVFADVCSEVRNA